MQTFHISREKENESGVFSKKEDNFSLPFHNLLLQRTFAFNAAQLSSVQKKVSLLMEYKWRMACMHVLFQLGDYVKWFRNVSVRLFRLGILSAPSPWLLTLATNHFLAQYEITYPLYCVDYGACHWWPASFSSRDTCSVIFVCGTENISVISQIPMALFTLKNKSCQQTISVICGLEIKQL